MDGADDPRTGTGRATLRLTMTVPTTEAIDALASIVAEIVGALERAVSP